MINYLHKYPAEVVVLCPDVETIKETERYREKTGYSGFTVETLYDTFMQTTPRIGFWPVSYTHLDGKESGGLQLHGRGTGIDTHEPKYELICSITVSYTHLDVYKRQPLYPPLTVMRSGHLIPLPGWNRLRKGALLFWKQCGKIGRAHV